MKLKLRRTQKTGMIGIGKVTFSLFAQTELTPEEAGYVKKYKMGKEVLYEKIKVEGQGVISAVKGGLLGMAAGAAVGLAARALNITITADDLVNGKSVDCKDIVEMTAVEEQIKEACAMFKVILESAAHFEGEEIIEI